MGVRWDAVVEDKGFWSAGACDLSAAPVGADRPVCVQAWLFGSLACGIAKRPLTLEFRRPFCVADVIAELGRVYGRTFLERVTNAQGGISRDCRVFVNGQAVEDAAAPIQPESMQADVELIMLTAAEGG